VRQFEWNSRATFLCHFQNEHYQVLLRTSQNLLAILTNALKCY